MEIRSWHKTLKAIPIQRNGYLSHGPINSKRKPAKIYAFIPVSTSAETTSLFRINKGNISDPPVTVISISSMCLISRPPTAMQQFPIASLRLNRYETTNSL